MDRDRCDGRLDVQPHPRTRAIRSSSTRDRKRRRDALVEHGATWADTPKAVSEQSDIVFTIVGFPADVREVYFGANGLLSAARAGQIFVDMTTTEPTLAKEIYEAARAKGADAVDAPVSGGDVGAQERDAVDHDRRRQADRRPR